jgi:hypothetical protein
VLYSRKQYRRVHDIISANLVNSLNLLRLNVFDGVCFSQFSVEILMGFMAVHTQNTSNLWIYSN